MKNTKYNYFNSLVYLVFIGVMFGLISCNRRVMPGDGSANFTRLEKALIKKGAGDAPMRVYKISHPQDSILLRQKSGKVRSKKDKKLVNLFVKRLYATVRDSMSLGVGIAAPQVGILKRIVWVQRFDKVGMPFEVYINPKIKQYSIKTQDCPEGCLSIPDRRELLKNRSYAILLEYEDQSGRQINEMVEDFTAVIFQHEIDHLDGILFIDHLEEEVNHGN